VPAEATPIEIATPKKPNNPRVGGIAISRGMALQGYARLGRAPFFMVQILSD
jgi:hypothetical protein